MPLSDKQKHLLHELYQVPYGSRTLYSRGLGLAATSANFDDQLGLRDQLLNALDFIDGDETMAVRVGEILAEYEPISTDPSQIDREGYSFRPEKVLIALRTALYPYTGISVQSHTHCRMTLG